MAGYEAFEAAVLIPVAVEGFGELVEHAVAETVIGKEGVAFGPFVQYQSQM